MNLHALPRLLVVAAGAGQFVLVVASVAIPRVLRWGDDLAKLRPLTRQVIWVHAGYIWCTNLAFALISTLAPGSLLDGSTLATAVSSFITVYWGARLVIQFAYLDRSAAPDGVLFRCAEAALVGLFALLTAIYLCAAAINQLGPLL